MAAGLSLASWNALRSVIGFQSGLLISAIASPCVISKSRESHAPIVANSRRSPFLSTPASIYDLFNVQRHLFSRHTLRIFRDQVMEEWNTERAAV